MFGFLRRKAEAEKNEETQRKVDELKKALFKDIDKTTKQTKKVNETIDRYEKREDITLNIFLATGGDKRS